MSRMKSKQIEDKQRISFYLKKDMYYQFKEKANRDGISAGLLFRIILMKYLNNDLKES